MAKTAFRMKQYREKLGNTSNGKTIDLETEYPGLVNDGSDSDNRYYFFGVIEGNEILSTYKGDLQAHPEKYDQIKSELKDQETYFTAKVKIDLPQLSGTEKQVKFANDVRKAIIDDRLKRYFASFSKNVVKFGENAKGTVRKMLDQTGTESISEVLRRIITDKDKKFGNTTSWYTDIVKMTKASDILDRYTSTFYEIRKSRK